MYTYLARRLLLIPWTLLCIILVNFVVINLAPGDPVSVTEMTAEGNASRDASSGNASGSDERYLQFREHYGLTLPILFNLWPLITSERVVNDLYILTTRKDPPNSTEEIPSKDYNALRTRFGDKAVYCMPKILAVMCDATYPAAVRNTASRFFARGGLKQAFLGSNLTKEQRAFNRKIAVDNNMLRSFIMLPTDSQEQINSKAEKAYAWYQANKQFYHFEPTTGQMIEIFFFKTRIYRYMSKVLTLDFGTMRNDSNKTVIGEVSKRFKYSLTLSLIPMLITFILCQLFGVLMAYQHNRWPDFSLNFCFLLLYALPIFVAAPFLIEKIAINHTFPFTDIPIPISGFTSPDSTYNNLNSYQRILDILQHICLPIIAIAYGSLAAQTRLARTAFLEVLRQDYVRTAWAKGVAPMTILFKHVGRNASITIVTALASSLGIVLAGSLIVETLFEINGFGKFFYDAIINRDYNVIMFSAFAGSFLSLIGYLMADIAYTVLDPRLSLE